MTHAAGVSAVAAPASPDRHPTSLTDSCAGLATLSRLLGDIRTSLAAARTARPPPAFMQLLRALLCCVPGILDTAGEPGQDDSPAPKTVLAFQENLLMIAEPHSKFRRALAGFDLRATLCGERAAGGLSLGGTR